MKPGFAIILWVAFATALSGMPNGVAQDFECVTNEDGTLFLRWYGIAGRSYFIQAADSADPLHHWYFLPLIEPGADAPISHELEEPRPAAAFFRLKYTTRVPGPGETLDTADFDDDEMVNLAEIEAYNQTDPLEPDCDGDGLPDGWEVKYGLDPHDATGPNGADGDPDGDGLTNLVEYDNGSHPCDRDSDGDGWLDIYENTIGTSATNPDTDGDGIPDNLDATPWAADQADFTATSLLVISPQQ